MKKKIKTIHDHIEDNPEVTVKELQKQFPDASKEELEKILSDFHEANPPWIEQELPPMPSKEEQHRMLLKEGKSFDGMKYVKHVPSAHRSGPRIEWLKKRDAQRAAFLEALSGDEKPFGLGDDQVFDLMTKRLEEMKEFRARQAADQKSPFDLEYRAKGPYRQKGIAFVIDDETDFSNACEHVGVSFRQGLHIAMKLFSQFHNPYYGL